MTEASGYTEYQTEVEPKKKHSRVWWACRRPKVYPGCHTSPSSRTTRSTSAIGTRNATSRRGRMMTTRSA